jgi:hypothetical protein
MRLLLSLVLLNLVTTANAQVYKCFKIVPKFKADTLYLNRAYSLGEDTLIITNFKFYISNLQYFKNDTLVSSSVKKAYLIDIKNDQTLEISENNLCNFDKIKFKVGIDSLTNVSGVFDGDLDPVNGMYWTWQSGYINFKLEGIATNCNARNNKFYWHIGGYLEPFYAIRDVTLVCDSNRPFDLIIQLDELIQEIDISKIYYVMSPSEKAIKIADVFPKIFKIALE